MNILMITTGKYPSGDAGAIRMDIFIKMLLNAGHRITVISRTTEDVSFENVKVFATRNSSDNRIVKLYQYLLFSKKAKQLAKKNAPFDAVYIYNAPISLFGFFKRYCKKNSIPIIHDCVEWYSSSEFKTGIFSHEFISKNIINRFVIDENVRVISISKYLDAYFCGKGIMSVRIPVLADKLNHSIEKRLDEKCITVMYAGSPGKKDLIGNSIRAYLDLSAEEQKKLKLYFIGSSKRHILKLTGLSESDIKDKKNIIINPRLPRKKVLEQLSYSDFVILPRNAELRYAKAGFPSKVVEALANSTAILCNYSSDLKEYLIDGYNAIIAKDHTSRSIYEAFKRIILLDIETRIQLQKNALLTAEKYFNYKLYENKFLELLENRNVNDDKLCGQ